MATKHGLTNNAEENPPPQPYRHPARPSHKATNIAPVHNEYRPHPDAPKPEGRVY